MKALSVLILALFLNSGKPAFAESRNDSTDPVPATAQEQDFFLRAKGLLETAPLQVGVARFEGSANGFLVDLSHFGFPYQWIEFRIEENVSDQCAAYHQAEFSRYSENTLFAILPLRSAGACMHRIKCFGTLVKFGNDKPSPTHQLQVCEGRENPEVYQITLLRYGSVDPRPLITATTNVRSIRFQIPQVSESGTFLTTIVVR